MSTSYPGGLDSYTTLVDNVDNVLAEHLNNPRDAIEAIETKLGTDSSTSSSSIDYFLKHNSGTFKTHEHDGSDAEKVDISNLTDNVAFSGKSNYTIKVKSDESGLEAVSTSSYSSIPKHYITGAEIITNSNTIKATAGVIELNGNELIRTSNTSILTTTTSSNYIGTDGSSSTGYIYIYIYNNTGNSWDIKLSSDSPQYSDTSSNIDGIKRYKQVSTIWYRCIGACHLTSGEITTQIYQDGNYIQLDEAMDISTIDVDQDSNLPTISKRGNFYIYHATSSSYRSIGIRPKSGTDYVEVYQKYDGGQYASSQGISGYVISFTDDNQKIDLFDSGSGIYEVKTVGYWINIRD